MAGKLGSFVPDVGPDDSWMLQIDPENRAKQQAHTLLQALVGPPRPSFNDVMMAFGRQSDNVQGPVELDEPVAVQGRQNAADFSTDRMTQYDPYAEQRRQQAIQIANALSGQGTTPGAAGVRDMRGRAAQEFGLEQQQQWGRSSPDVIPGNFRQRAYGKHK